MSHEPIVTTYGPQIDAIVTALNAEIGRLTARAEKAERERDEACEQCNKLCAWAEEEKACAIFNENQRAREEEKGDALRTELAQVKAEVERLRGLEVQRLREIADERARGGRT
ncbi:MAG: hypothetical protein RLZZ524_2128 [Pseudomonadota bacterium]|jgi:hypothetical protein